MKHLTALTRPVLAAALALGVVMTPAPTSTAATTHGSDARATATTTDEPGKLLLMLDASGSMKEKDPSGGTKMAAAKKALTGVVDALPSDVEVGLRVYGAQEEGGKPTKAACADTQLVAPIAPLDKAGLKKAITGFEAKGETPIAHSLTEGLKDLGDTGPRSIILVSDGEESCVPDPCPVVEKLVEDGVDLRIDTVGFGVDKAARTQLQCLADAGDGTYYDARDADELESSLKRISTRAVRDFRFTGAPVTGVDVGDGGQLPDDLPELTPGLHTDTLAASEDTWRAYTVERTQQESTLHVSATTRPDEDQDEDEDGTTLEELDIKILAPDGTACTAARELGGSKSIGVKPAVTVTARLLGQVPDEDSSHEEVCREKGDFTVLLHREGVERSLPTEIQVIEEPRVTNFDRLPDAVDGYPQEKELTARDPKPVTGGLSFADAAEITEGTWVDTLVPGETLLYRVKVEDGQTARFTVNGPTGGFRYPDVRYSNLWIDGRAFAPDRQSIGSTSQIAGSFSDDLGDNEKSVTAAPIRYKNRYAPTYTNDNLAASSMSGWHYYAVSVGTKELGKELAGQPIKVAFTVGIDGDPSGDVEYEGGGDWSATMTGEQEGTSETPEEESTAADAPAGEDEGGSPLPWIGGGVLLAGLVGAGTWLALRRRA